MNYKTAAGGVVDWTADIRSVFPDWKTEAALLGWPSVRATLRIGQVISGIVIARAPFGIWLDIGVPIPALLLVTNIQLARETRMQFEEYPRLGTQVNGRINALGDKGEIGITQLNPDKMIEGVDHS